MRTLPAWVRTYIGAEFEPQGRGPRYDCWGLCMAVLHEQFGKTLPGFEDAYSCRLGGDEVAKAITDGIPVVGALPVSYSAAQPGDIVLVRLIGRAMHTGVYVGSGALLHINKGINAVCEDLASPRLRNRIIGFYRVR